MCTLRCIAITKATAIRVIGTRTANIVPLTIRRNVPAFPLE